MENLEELQKKVFDSLEIDENNLPAVIDDAEKFKAFRALLMRRIEELAEKEMEKLLWALYRIDVSEKKLHEVLQQTPPDKFSSTIADLIIERQRQKIETRKKYGGEGGDWSFEV
jgi:hypothetical protein